MNNILDLSAIRANNNQPERAVDIYSIPEYTDTLFDVNKEPLFLDNGMIAPDHMAVVRDGEVVSVVGSKYKLVKNSEVFSSFEQAIASSDLNTNGMIRKLSMSHNGARTFARYQFPEHQIEVARGDTTHMEIVVKNSYDGSCSFETLLGGFRLVCANGQILGEIAYQKRHKHTQNLNVDYTAEYLTVWAEKFQAVGDKWRKWKNTPLTETATKAAFDSYNKSERVQDQLQLILAGNIDSIGDNLYALYNTITEHSTHAKVGQKQLQNKADTVSRREDSARKAERVITSLAA